MKKQIIAAITAIFIVAVSCLAGGKYYLINSKSSDKIISLELPPFSDDIVLYEGESAYEKFFEVIYENGFSSKDIEFVSENENIAYAKYSLTDRNRYVCYKVTAVSVGETYIYFTANDGQIISEKIKVTVLTKKSDDLISSASEEQTFSEPQRIDETQSTISEKTDNTTKEVYDETEKIIESENTAVSENNSNCVYITPSGKRYHYSKSCAGKNAYAVTKSQATESGKTPCKKCAGG